MKLRYPAAGLIMLSAVSGLGFVFLLVTSVGVESEAQMERLEERGRLCSWVWKVSTTLLVLLLIYRWFIVWSPHGRD